MSATLAGDRLGIVPARVPLAAPTVSPWSSAVWVLAAMGLGCSLEQQLNADSASATESGTGSATGGADQADTTAGQVPAACAGRELRVATYNIESVDPVGSGSYGALASVLGRISPDIVCVQEIVDGEGVAFSELATDAGYEHALKADRSPAIGGELSNGCMARFPMAAVGSWSGEDLSTDSQANDVGRDIFAVRMDVSGDAPCHLGVITVHAKSGQEPLDWFRRQIEAVRLTQAVAKYRDAFPEDALAVVGDFNETLDDSALGTVFDAAPADLPNSYRLGTDIVFPLTYQPFETLSSVGFELTSPGQEDAPERRETWRDTVRLDYVWLSDAEWIAGEVYNGCRDNGVDDAPPGAYIDKVGDPLDCSVTDLASDHFAVVADIRLP